MTIFALEQAVSNGCQPCITEVESALVEVAALRADLDRAIVNLVDAAATVCDMRAQLAEAQRDAEQLREAAGRVPPKRQDDAPLDFDDAFDENLWDERDE